MILKYSKQTIKLNLFKFNFIKYYNPSDCYNYMLLQKNKKKYFIYIYFENIH